MLQILFFPKKISIIFFFIASLCFLIGCKDEPVSQSEFIFNTRCRISIFDEDLGRRKKEALLTSCIETLNQLNEELDVVNSESQLNSQLVLGDKRIVLYGEQAALFDICMKQADYFHGLFDPTIAPLVSLWQIGMGGNDIPSKSAIKESLKAVGWEKIAYQWILSDEGSPAAIEILNYPDFFALDFGAAAKGYAADKIITLLTDNGVKHAVINIGGNVSVIGRHPDDRLWRIGVQNPDGERGEYVCLLDMEGLSASTSGIYERFFYKEGIRYHHLLDQQTGYPAVNELASVTVVSKDAVMTDICSTALFVAGKAGEQLALELEGIEALFIYKDGSFSVTPDLFSFLQVNSSSSATETNILLGENDEPLEELEQNIRIIR